MKPQNKIIIIGLITATGASIVAVFGYLYFIDNPAEAGAGGRGSGLDRQAYMSEVLRITGEQPNTALDFDGDNDYVDCGNDSSLDITGAITIEAWVKTSTDASQDIIAKFDNTANDDAHRAWLIKQDATTGSIKAFMSRTSAGAIGTTNVHDNFWHHIMVSHTDGSSKLYIDSVLEDTATDATLITNDIPITIGARITPDISFNGTIDGVKIYNRALSAEEVKDRYNGKDVPVNAADTTTSNGESVGADVTIEVADTTGFTTGDKAQITATSTETITVTVVDGTTITATLVNDYYGAGATVERSDLVLDMGFGEGTGTTPADSSVYENNGTFGDVPAWIDYSSPVVSFDKMPVLWIAPQYGYESAAKYFDLSGNENHATQSNATYQPKFRPPGLLFDGADDYLDCGSDSSLDITDAITMEAWVKLANTKDYQGLVDKADGWADSNGFRLIIHDNGLRLQYGNGTGSSNLIIGSQNTADGNWHHVVATIDATYEKLYQDGIEIGSDSSGGLGSSTANLLMGYLTAGAPDYFHGSIDGVKIWDRALSATQINALYLAGLPGHQ